MFIKKYKRLDPITGNKIHVIQSIGEYWDGRGKAIRLNKKTIKDFIADSYNAYEFYNLFGSTTKCGNASHGICEYDDTFKYWDSLFKK